LTNGLTSKIIVLILAEEAVIMATEEQIRALAYSIWEQEGHPEGKHEEHYLRAKQILEEKEKTSSIDFKEPPPVINLPSPSKRRSQAERKKKEEN
jgi:hypothetical protein